MKDTRKKQIIEKLHKLDPLSEEVSIFRVPNVLRNVDKEAYSPRIVSIGPFHHGIQAVAAMKEHKWRYMQYLFQRIDDPQDPVKCVEECTSAIYELEAEVRRNYAERMILDTNDLAEMMIIDGCFILELLLRYDELHSKNNTLGDKSDPVFYSDWMMRDLRHDLALLENQIPFFIIHRLYETVKPCLKVKPPNSVASLALKFFEPMSQKPITEEPGLECKHLLDLLYKFYFSPDLNSISIPLATDLTPKGTSGFKYSAASRNFRLANIRFEQGSTEKNLSSITTSAGTIKIPPVFFNETTISLLRNLIAFEQCSLCSTHRVIPYVVLLRSLIRSNEDIQLLEGARIINTSIDSQEFHTDQFATILDKVVVKDFCFGKLCDEVNAAADALRWRSEYQRMLEMYLATPGSFISTYLSFVATVLAVIQTYYAVYGSNR